MWEKMEIFWYKFPFQYNLAGINDSSGHKRVNLNLRCFLFGSDKMDKQVLLSSQGTMSTSQYAVGLLKDGKQHGYTTSVSKLCSLMLVNCCAKTLAIDFVMTKNFDHHLTKLVLMPNMFSLGELHLTPLQGIIQLRPNFEYVDRAKDKKTSDVKEEGLL